MTREGHLWLSSRKVPPPGESVSWRIHDLAVELLPLWVEDNGWMFMAADEEAGVTCFISYGFVRLMGRQPGGIACWRT